MMRSEYVEVCICEDLEYVSIWIRSGLGRWRSGYVRIWNM